MCLRLKYLTRSIYEMSSQTQKRFLMKMKKLRCTLLLGLFLVLCSNLNAQNVAITNDGSTADPSAMLDVKSDSLGILIPRITLANRPASPATGLLIFQTDNNPGFYYWDGSTWQKVENFGELESLILAEETARVNADSGLQTELNATQTGAGLASNGNYSPNSSANFINTASSLTNADNLLDARIKDNSTNISDADGDTKIQVEKNANEDKIRFELGGNEAMIIDTAGKVGIGTSSPTSNLEVNGTFRLQNGTSINEFSTDSFLAGNSDDAVPTEKAVKTYISNVNNINGLSDGKTVGSSIFLGFGAGNNNIANSNTAIGQGAGYQNQTGSGNIFLGFLAGYNETGSNKLYIENSLSDTPLIYGEFENNILTINGNLGIGTSSPTYAKLQIEGPSASDGTIRIINTGPGGGSIFMGVPNEEWGIGPNKFVIGDGDPGVPFINLTIDSTGQVGIGDYSPSSTLDVNGTFQVKHGTSINEISEDGTFSNNSDDAIPTEAAVKTYVETRLESLTARVAYLESIYLDVQYRLDLGESPWHIYQSDPSLLDDLYGKTYQGGLIFYLGTTSGHVLVSASADQENADWDYNGDWVNATGSCIGCGYPNTEQIHNKCSDFICFNAAETCYRLELNGYSDWYLPSKVELELMYANLKQNGFGNFGIAWYWSSTESNPNSAYEMDFNNGTVEAHPKTNFSRVRPVRRIY